MGIVELAGTLAGLAPLLDELAGMVELHPPHLQIRRDKGRDRGMAVGDENIAVRRRDHIAGRLEMAVIVAALARGAQPHQDLAGWRKLNDLQSLAAVLADGAIGNPDIAVTIDMQAMGEHEQPGADALDRFAGGHVELDDGRVVGAVATIGAAAVDGPDLAMRATLDPGARTPCWFKRGRTRRRRRPLMV